MVHEDNGLLVDPNEPAQLLAALTRLVDDPRLRRRFGEAGARRARQYSPQRRAQRYLQLYESVLRGERPSLTAGVSGR